MSDFMIRFLICNLWISCIIGILLVVKKLFKKILTSRMQYNLWFLLFILLLIPFVPSKPTKFFSIFALFSNIPQSELPNNDIVSHTTNETIFENNMNWMNDFTLSITQDTSSIFGLILGAVWIIVKVKSFAPRQIQRRLFAALVTLSRKVFRPWHKWF